MAGGRVGVGGGSHYSGHWLGNGEMGSQRSLGASVISKEDPKSGSGAQGLGVREMMSPSLRRRVGSGHPNNASKSSRAQLQRRRWFGGNKK